MKCRECDWIGTDTDVLRGANPFNDSESVYGCPNCLSVDSMQPVCDHQDCWKLATCGTPTKDGYRSTCGEHKPEAYING